MVSGGSDQTVWMRSLISTFVVCMVSNGFVAVRRICSMPFCLLQICVFYTIDFMVINYETDLYSVFLSWHFNKVERDWHQANLI